MGMNLLHLVVFGSANVVFQTVSLSTPNSAHLLPEANGRRRSHHSHHGRHVQHQHQQQNIPDSKEKFRQEIRNYKDSQYYGEINVGSQTLQAVLDTGSTELVVLSDKCKHKCAKNLETLYHGSASSTFQQGTLALGIEYGSGNLKGQEAYDNVSIGPFSSSDVPFWEIQDANMPILAASEFQAIVGLGPIPPHVATMQPGDPQNNLSYALVLRKLGIPKYSVCLKSEPGSPGYVTWNDDAHIAQPELFNMIKVTGSGYWVSKLTDVKLGTQALTFCENGCGAIIDSGTSLLAVPSDVFDELAPRVQKLGDDEGCNVNHLPDLRFRLNGVHYSLPPDSYLGQVFGEIPSGIASNFRKSNSACQAALMSIDLPPSKAGTGKQWILGMPFFRNFYTVFVQDQDHPRIYTARSTEDCYPSTGKALQYKSKTEVQKPRKIDASKLRVAPWLHKHLGKTTEKADEQPMDSHQNQRVLFTPL